LDVVKKGTLVWSGEHWINYLRRPGEGRDNGMVSLYHTRQSAAGEGTAAFIDIPGDEGLTALCTDNRDVAELVLETMIRGRGTPFDRDMPVVDAWITRDGDIRKNPSWTVRLGGREIVSTWRVAEPPVIMYGPAPSGIERIEIFSVLYFTNEASITVDGRAVSGEPYTRDIWRSSIGGDRSSSVFALAETIIRVG
jgi:hypothetical protein